MIVLGILLIIFSLFLIVAVLLQQGKNHNLSGTIAGGAETFFGKSKAQTMNKKLSVLTTVAAVIFVVMVIVVYCVNTPNSGSNLGGLFGGNEEVTHAHDHAEDTTTAAPADTTTAPVDTTTAPVDTTTAPAK